MKTEFPTFPTRQLRAVLLAIVLPLAACDSVRGEDSSGTQDAVESEVGTERDTSADVSTTDVADDSEPNDTTSDETASEDTAPQDTAQEDTAQEDTAQEDTAQEDTAQEDATLPDLADVVDPGPPNLVLVVLDDVGVEVVEPWASIIGATGEVAETPTLNELLEHGVAIETAWAGATCSPTRWTLHTGTYPSRGGPLGPSAGPSGLTADSATLPRILGETYSTGLFGKWHLGGGNSAAVTLGGWDVYSGSPDGGLRSYFEWERVSVSEGSSAVVEESTTYATTAVVEDALVWLETVDPERPWLTMLAFNAPHSPFHLPPESLRPSYPTVELDSDGDGECDRDGPCHRAMLQALDSELGRFLRAASAFEAGRDTLVIVLGDNGTPSSAVQAPFDRTHAKGTLFEGGIRVPMWISGPPNRVSARGVLPVMAHSADLFATLIELGGAEVPTGVDAVSQVSALLGGASVRDTLYMDGEVGRAQVTERAATRGARYKVQWLDVTVPNVFACYDLENDPNEQVDLMAGDAPPARCDALWGELLEVRR